MLDDVKVVSLDLETYGLVRRGVAGNELPNQTVFQPKRSLMTDKVLPQDMILTCALTLPKEDPRTPQVPLWSGGYLEALTPGETMVLQLNDPDHRRVLGYWLRWADTIVGWNLPFDIMYLRALPDFRYVLDGLRHFLIDGAIIRYLHDETSPARSLKNIGPILRTHSYDDDEAQKKQKRYDTPYDPKLHSYNAQDTHNTLLSVAELTRRILSEFPGTPKCSAFCLQFYSDLLWTIVRMTEGGIAMNRTMIEEFEVFLLARTQRLHALAAKEFGLPFEGEGSGKAKDAFMEYLCDVIDEKETCQTPHDCSQTMAVRLGAPADGTPATAEADTSPKPSDEWSVRDNPLLERTDVQKKLSFSDANRSLLHEMLPHRHPLARLLRLATKFRKAQKLASTYTFPLLRHQRNKPANRSSVLLPLSDQATRHRTTSIPSSSTSTSSNGTSESWKRSCIQLAHPQWYPTPGSMKDGAGDEGGTKQGRITCKKPPAQTFPPQVKRAITSRFDDGVIVGMDLSQIELRGAGLLSGESTLVKFYQKGEGDLHSMRAHAVFGDTYLRNHYGHEWSESLTFRKKERQVGKRTNFADLFRAGAKKMQHAVLGDIGIEFPLDLFQRIVNARPFLRPGLWEWQNELIAETRKKGYLELPLIGQSRWFLGGEKWDENEIVNFPIQTMAGNTMLCVQNALHKYFLPSISAYRPWCVMTHQVYDAIYFDVHHDKVPQLEECIEAAVDIVETQGYWHHLQDLTGNEVPLTYDLEVIPSRT